MYPIDLTDKHGIVFGIANHRSIAWAIAQILHDAGANLAIAYQNERVKNSVARLVEDWEGDTPLIECDVSDDFNVAATFDTVGDRFGSLDIMVHSIAFANRDDLGGPFLDTDREGFRLALDISAYSLLPIARYGAPLMEQNGGSILTLTFQAANRVFPGYNVMGTAKAALENEVKQLASDLGQQNIRVNAISAGSARHAVIPRHQPLPRHEAHPRRAFSDAAQHHRGRGGKGCAVPVQRPVGGDNRGDTACGHGV